jgi:ATP synthase subunit 6
MFNTIILTFFLSPLEQYDIFIVNNCLVVTNIIIFLCILLGSCINYKINTLENSTFLTILKYNIINFVINCSYSNINLIKQFLLVLYLYIFILILFSNLLGLIPYSYTITSSFLIALTFSFIYFLIINLIAIYNKGFIMFTSIFYIRDISNIITPLLTIIEIVSYFARLFSLAIRLFANMMAGHTLLKILIGFTFVMIMQMNFITFSAIIPWIIIFLIVILEILIACLQAYVFLILLSIYVNETLN